MPAPYNFKKDGKSDDGPELTRYLSETTHVNTIAALPSGSYRIMGGQHVGPGSLGVLPSNARFRLESSGGYTLIVS